MSASGSTRAILAALTANAGIAVAKFVGFLITGSSSMLAESVHSVADTSNQALLLLGIPIVNYIWRNAIRYPEHKPAGS